MRPARICTEYPVTSRGAADQHQGQVHAHLRVISIEFVPQAAELDESTAPRSKVEALRGRKRPWMRLRIGADNEEPLEEAVVEAIEEVVDEALDEVGLQSQSAAELGSDSPAPIPSIPVPWS